VTWPANSDRRLLQAERDLTRAARQVELAQTRAAAVQADAARAGVALAQERSRSAQLEAALNQVYTSTSWRVSRPIRVVSRIMMAVRGRRPPPPPALIPPDEPASPVAQPSLPRREAAILQRLQRQAN
jgi:hypothetical protein